MTLLVAAQEWGEFRGDSRRSGISTANLPAIELEEIWRTEPRLVTPAWPAPARWDAFASLAGLKAMRNYDPVMHPVLADNRVYFGSNTDDHMYCLDAGSGEVLWTFDSGGPIRVPPTVKKNRLWFGSDDGFARCLNALNGELIWEVEAVPGSEKVIHDGRLISFFPVRTGVLVEEGVAFFGASLLPWKPSTLVAVNAGTGSLKGKPNLFRREVGSGWTLEGALLYSKDSIVAPQGRIPPLLFDRKTGAPQGALEGGGGSFVVLTEDEQVLVGPGNKDGWITASEKQSRTKIASYAKGNSMVVHEDTAYMLADRTLASLDRVTGAMLWSRPSSTPFELILAGETLFCGGNDMVRAYRKTDGRLLWEHAIEGRAYGLAVAENLLVVSTDEGVLHAFAPSGKKAELPVDDWVAEPSTMSRPEPRPKLPKRGLLDHWVFEQPERIEEQVFPNDPRTVSAIRNQVKNRPSARPMAPLRLVPCGSGHAAELDGKANDFAVPGSLEDFELPLKGLTVGAWVRVDRPMEWGGILSAGQDNGEYERGWFLGFRHNHLSFGLAAEEGGGKQHWVQSPTAFQPGGWHWVVGTWDGKEQNLWVDGALVASSNAQSGSIAMPDRIHYQIGAYRDDNEWYRMTGQLYEVAVWSRALRSKELEKWYEKSVDRFPDPVEIVPEEPKSSEPKLASLVLESGPFVKFSSRGVAHVTWLEAQGAMPKAVLEWREQGAEDGHWNASSPGDSYPYAIADKLNPNTLYEARIRDQGAASELFEIDTHFDGSLPPSPLTLSVVPPEIRAWGDSLR
ncbi:MAG: PQQ-binding-like beta-propeller repeat protein, partial [Planctomycetes bacterium]|nr:PQQ-binding-like beta-propeller repeat protein [Planctomycetota bacterium]